jgi:DNA-binding NtrC family response regulator
LLQEGEYFSLGTDQPRQSRARVVVATHQDLAVRQSAGSFRKDLFFRLRTHHLHVPPLRERKDDIPLLLDRFLDEAARDLGKKKPTPPRELSVLLAAYSFPGNVRELRSLVYDAVSAHQEEFYPWKVSGDPSVGRQPLSPIRRNGRTPSLQPTICRP